MAYYKNHKYFKTVKVYLTEETEDKESNEDRPYVTLREPTTTEAFSLRTDNEDEAVEAFHALLENIIIDHNFYADETETEKLCNGEVSEVIYESYPSFIKVLTEYTNSVFQVARG